MDKAAAEFRKVYKRVAVKVHPDRGPEKSVRDLFMKRANRAKMAQDLAALIRIEQDWERLTRAYQVVQGRCSSLHARPVEHARWLSELQAKAQVAFDAANCDVLDKLASLQIGADLKRLPATRRTKPATPSRPAEPTPTRPRPTTGSARPRGRPPAGASRPDATESARPRPEPAGRPAPEDQPPTPPRPPSQPPGRIQVGDRVRHPKFGDGVVLERHFRNEGHEYWTELTIQFGAVVGIKRLLIGKAKLEKLEKLG